MYRLHSSVTNSEWCMQQYMAGTIHMHHKVCLIGPFFIQQHHHTAVQLLSRQLPVASALAVATVSNRNHGTSCILSMAHIVASSISCHVLSVRARS
jgi:hypothetical protein